jgi:RNA-directed DNA polymerase
MIIERVSLETGVNSSTIEAFINSASRLYKTYKIPKRTGGFRQISQPTPALKFLQRWVVRNFVSHLPVHPLVTSYRQGMGIRRNAEMHVDRNFLLKMDFQDFFPSIKDVDVRYLFAENIKVFERSELNDVDIDLIAKIVCRDGSLTIGAPSSPSISNAALFSFDQYIASESTIRGIQYTRYADDILFSTNTPDILVEIHEIVLRTLEQRASPHLAVNDKKTVYTSKKRKRLVTGLVLTSNNRVSIGRSKKREIKTLCYQFCNGKLSPEKASYLRGYLSYVSAVEPEFIQTLGRKYGFETMQKIMGLPLIQLK